LDSDHHNPEKPTKGNTEPERDRKKTLQAQPSEERNGYTVRLFGTNSLKEGAE
jgi:hypothetical protein